MADCGASGSALDRAARSFLGGNVNSAANESSKHVASFMGHAVGGASSAAPAHAMPIAAPDHLVLPGVDASMNVMSGRKHSVAIEANEFRESIPQQHHVPHMHHPMHGPQTLQPNTGMMQANMIHQHQHAQQVHMMSIMMEQQHMQNQHMQEILRQQQLAKQSSDQSNLDRLQSDGKVEEDVEGHEGLVRGATIEQLAAAWAEAEADYQELEQAVNMGGAVSNPETDDSLPHHSYEFINRDVEDVHRDAKDWMEEGVRHFQAGNTKEAIRAFEMELQVNNPDNSKAWRFLGRCHAENDQDREAIVCLEQAVDRDPYNPEARLALGVSYVNELNHAKALENLKAWITHNPKFSGIHIDEDVDVYGAANSSTKASGEANVESAFDEVQRLLLRALEFAGSDTTDILEALGVVYNVSRDYEAAIDAFRKAVEMDTENYQLYNRLGATLANCNQSDKALPAYRKAIELKPKYARAWLNMAISHSNLQNYDEAAR